MPTTSPFRKSVEYNGFKINPMFGTSYWWVSYGGQRVGELFHSVGDAKLWIDINS